MGAWPEPKVFQTQAGAEVAVLQVVPLRIFNLFYDYVWNHDFSDLSGILRRGNAKEGHQAVLDLPRAVEMGV